MTTDVELLERVEAQIEALETEVARAQLEFWQLPSDDQSVRRLVFGRYLLLTLRLREHGAIA